MQKTVEIGNLYRLKYKMCTFQHEKCQIGRFIPYKISNWHLLGEKYQIGRFQREKRRISRFPHEKQ